MPRRHDDDEDDDSDDEFDLPDGVYHDDELPTVRCPYCRAEVLEELEQCPRCGNYRSREDAPMERRSWFFYAMMAAALGCAVWWMVFL